VWGGGCLFVPAGKLNDKKIENKTGGAQALGGCQSIKKRHNQPDDSVSGRGLFEMRHYCGGMYGGDNITSFGRQINRQKLMKEKIHRGPRRPPNNEKNTTTNRKHAGSTGERRGMRRNRGGGAVGVQVDCFRAIKLGLVLILAGALFYGTVTLENSTSV
jgi:hypothetical protein